MTAKIKPYNGAAAGWGAVRAVVNSIRHEMNVQHGLIALFHMNKVDGFDCPGCAWPDPKHTSSFDVCENGAKAVSWEATEKRADVEFFKTHTVNELLGWEPRLLEQSGRLTTPLKYDPSSDKYVPIEWEVAFAEIAQKLQSFDDPNVVEFYTSGRASNEAAFLYQLFARMYGTNNFPDCSNMCHEPTSVGLMESIGVGKGTVKLEDFEHCDLVICIGHNPGTNHPRMLTSLREVALRGAKIIAINPMQEVGLTNFISPQNPYEMLTDKGTPLANDYYHVRVGGDIALMKGIMRCLIEMHEKTLSQGREGILDIEFVQNHTNGYRELRTDVLNTDWEHIVESCGLSEEDIQRLAASYASSQSTIICYGMGITQHEHGTRNVQQLVNLLLLKGNIGKKGAGICPLRGHSNVQGDRTVGITEKPSSELLHNLNKRFGFIPPSQFGHSAVESMKAICNGKSKALICLGGNFAAAMPDYAATYPKLKELELTVHLATKLNTSHLLVSKNSYVFPVLGRTEKDLQNGTYQFVSVEDSMSVVHSSCGVLTPASEDLKSECEIIAGIAKATLGQEKVNWDELKSNYDKIRDHIEEIFPDFSHYNERVRKPGGFTLTNSAAERRWSTASGRANFMVSSSLLEDPMIANKKGIVLATVRSHDQYNTTIYGMDDRYRGVYGQRDVLFLSKETARSMSINDGERVNIIALESDGTRSDRRMNRLKVVIYKMADKTAVTYFPESNHMLTLDHFDEQSGIPAYKSIPIEIEICD